MGVIKKVKDKVKGMMTKASGNFPEAGQYKVIRKNLVERARYYKGKGRDVWSGKDLRRILPPVREATREDFLRAKYWSYHTEDFVREITWGFGGIPIEEIDAMVWNGLLGFIESIENANLYGLPDYGEKINEGLWESYKAAKAAGWGQYIKWLEDAIVLLDNAPVIQDFYDFMKEMEAIEPGWGRKQASREAIEEARVEMYYPQFDRFERVFEKLTGKTLPRIGTEYTINEEELGVGW